MNKELFDNLKVKWPEKLLFIGSGLTTTPRHWLGIPSIRTNNKTLGRFPTNDIFGIMTWPAVTDEGLGGVWRSTRYKDANPKPYIFLFDLELSIKDKKIFWYPNKKMYHIPVKERFEQPEFKHYVKQSDKFLYEPRNSTGMYIILWLLYAPVKQIYISGYDGWMGLTGNMPGVWETNRVHYDVNGKEWCPHNNQTITSDRRLGRNNKFFYHNLYTEWLAIQDAIKKAEKRGVKVYVAKEQY